MKDFAQHGWKEVSLGEICEKTETVDPRKAPEDEFDYVDVSSVSNETFTIGETQKLLGADAPSRARRQIRSGDIIFATIRPTLQRIAQVPEHLDRQVCSTGYMVLRPKPSLDARFLMHALFRPDFMDAMETLQSGASYPAVTDKQVRDQKIPLPPLEEQQRIVAVLDEAFEGLARARAHAEANLQNARELFERAEEVVLDKDNEVDGKVVQLSDVAELRGGFAFKSRQYTETGHFVLRTVNITPDGTITRHNPKFISEDELESHKKFALEPYDTLFVMVGATLGKTGFVEPDDLPALLNQNMWVIRARNEEITSHYLYHVFRRITRPAMEKATGTARGFLKRDDVRTLSFNLPPKEHQLSSVEQIVALRERALAAEQEYKTKLHDLDDLRQSLLQKAFAGGLT